MRSVFSSESVKVVQFGEGAPPGGPAAGHLSGSEGWRAVTRVLRSCAAFANLLRDDTVTTIFPDDCAVCACPMTAWSAAPVCDACLRRVGPQAGALCSICGEALGMESARFAAAMGIQTCSMCRLAPPDFARAVAYAAYDDELREMLHLFKYGRVRSLANGKLGEWLAQAVTLLADDIGPNLTVIAVPLFTTREKQRGFNQSIALAEAALLRLKKSLPLVTFQANHQAMARVRDTEAQYGLRPRQRRANLRGAFCVTDSEAVRGRQVLLIDDIMTTGATARECARVLIRAGAATVWVATLARAQAENFGTNDIATWDAVEPGIAAGFV